MDEDTLAAHADTAMARSHVYGLLAAVFRKEPSPSFIEEIRGPRFARALAALDADLGDDFAQMSNDALSAQLRVEFTRLFLGPGTHISPHESVFTEIDGESGGLYGAQTVAVKKFIETTGLDYDDNFTGLPDHICVELEFMHKLAGFEADKWASSSEQEAKYCLSVQKLFVEQHLLGWIPAFCQRVAEAADGPFYREIARITKEFLDFDIQSIKSSLA